MGWLLLLIVGGSIVLSGVLSGLALAMHNVTGVSFPRLFGDPAQKHDLGLIPTLLLKIGIFSIPTIWGTFLMGFGSRAEITLLFGVGSGALLALINVLLVKILIRFKRIGFELLGLIIGLVIGGLIGMVAMIMIGLDVSESPEANFFWCVSMGIGSLVGLLNGRTLSRMLTRIQYHAIVCEIAAGSAVFGSVGIPIMWYAWYLNASLVFHHGASGVLDIFDALMLVVVPVTFGGLIAGCCAFLNYGGAVMLRAVEQGLLSRITRSSVSLKLVSLFLLAGSLGGVALGVAMGVQHLMDIPFRRVSLMKSINGDSLAGGFPVDRILRATPDGGYLAALDRFVWKVNRKGREEWQYHSSSAPDFIRMLEPASDLGALLIYRYGDRAVIKLDSSGHEAWETPFRGKAYELQATPDGGFFLTWTEPPDPVVDLADPSSFFSSTFPLDVAGNTQPTQESGHGVSRFDSHGRLLWEHVRSHENAALLGGHGTSDGGYIMAGIGWIRKISSAGECQWEYAFRKNEIPTFYIVSATPEGEAVIGGLSGVANAQRITLSKLDGQGNLLWERSMELPELKQVSRIVASSHGRYILLIGTDAHSSKRPWIMGCNSQGEPLWEYTFNPDAWPMFEFYKQSAREWDSFLRASDRFLKQWNIRRGSLGREYPFRYNDENYYEVHMQDIRPNVGDNDFTMLSTILVRRMYSWSDIIDFDVWFFRIDP